jgi:thiol-disulfide isomerase/thioredoxin
MPSRGLIVGVLTLGALSMPLPCGDDACAGQKERPRVELKTVKLNALLKEIAGLKDKVVVVDVWATFCVPCKEGFPHLVELQKKYADKGVVCVSVSVDDSDAHAAALKFLKKQDAAFPNYLLDEAPPAWQDHWDITAIPAMFIYRDGKQLAKFTYDDPDNQFTHADVEKKVISLLKARNP